MDQFVIFTLSPIGGRRNSYLTLYRQLKSSMVFDVLAGKLATARSNRAGGGRTRSRTSARPHPVNEANEEDVVSESHKSRRMRSGQRMSCKGGCGGAEIVQVLKHVQYLIFRNARIIQHVPPVKSPPVKIRVQSATPPDARTVFVTLNPCNPPAKKLVP